jgi:hypothetical protein
MRQHTRLAFTLIVAFVPFGTFGSAAHAACNPGQLGTSADCPEYTAPSTTAVPGPSMGATVNVGPAPTTLFDGVVPPNGFMAQINQPSSVGNICNINDNGPASNGGAGPNGFLFGGIWITTPLPNIFVTPPGYKPMGPLSIACTGGGHVEVRGW